MKAIKTVWRRISTDGEPPELLAELATEEERYHREMESIHQMRDGIVAELRQLGETPNGMPGEQDGPPDA